MRGRAPRHNLDTPSMSFYVVERYVSGPPEERLESISRQLRKAAGELVSEGVDVRYLQSILLHGEESCTCLFEAPSDDEVRLVNQRAGLSYLRVVRAAVYIQDSAAQ